MAFSRDATYLVDRLDAALGVYPTFPTIIGAVTMTIIPKARVHRAELVRALATVTGESIAIPRGKDFILLGHKAGELIALSEALSTLAAQDAS